MPPACSCTELKFAAPCRRSTHGLALSKDNPRVNNSIAGAYRPPSSLVAACILKSCFQCPRPSMPALVVPCLARSSVFKMFPSVNWGESDLFEDAVESVTKQVCLFEHFAPSRAS